MVDVKRQEDRRTLRTRQLLRNGFVEVMREKGFASMSIQDIVNHANVNRGTFYIHYTDKYMLLDEIVRYNFRKMMESALSPESKWDKRALQAIILTVLNCFESKYHHRQPSSRFPATLLEQTIHKELTNYLIRLIRADCEDASQDMKRMEAKARVVGWAIFGAAIQWSQEPIKMSIDQMAGVILSVIEVRDSVRSDEI